MGKLFFYICILLLTVFPFLWAQTGESVTISTYYPSPYGSYDELTANKMKVGRTYSQPGIVVNNDDIIVEGRIGIGTATPQRGLHVVEKGGVRIEGSAPAFQLDEYGQPNYQMRIQGGNLRIETNDDAFGSPNLTAIFDSAGNVGIGLVNPTAMLDVNGNARVRGNVTVDGAVVTRTACINGDCRSAWPAPRQGNCRQFGGGGWQRCPVGWYLVGLYSDDDDDYADGAGILCCEF